MDGGDQNELKAMFSDSQRAREAIVALHRNMQNVAAPRVLFVDDDQEDAYALRYTVGKKYPFVRIEWRDNADSAIATVKAFKFDLVILDLKFQLGTGVDIYKSIRQVSSVPIVALTGLESNSDLVQQAMAAGMEIVFRKPLSEQSIDLIFSAP